MTVNDKLKFLEHTVPRGSKSFLNAPFLSEKFTFDATRLFCTDFSRLCKRTILLL